MTHSLSHIVVSSEATATTSTPFVSPDPLGAVVAASLAGEVLALASFSSGSASRHTHTTHTYHILHTVIITVD